MDYEQIVRQYVQLGRTTPKGWSSVVCRVCNDHGKKGARSGFNFSDGIGYNCFNCDISFHHPPSAVDMPSKDAETILRAFGIPDDALLDPMRFNVIQNRTNGGLHTDIILERSRPTVAQVLEPPAYFKPLIAISDDEPIGILARMHIEEDRALVPGAYPYMIGVRTDDPDSHAWANRLIIPVLNVDRKFIFWQGRALLPTFKGPKYKNPDVPKDGVVYGMDEIMRHTGAPLYITEGIFDAMHVKGVAILGRTIAQPIIDMLNASPRPKIVIPDRFGNGEDLAAEAIQQGWQVATPDIGACKDITEAVVKYGRLYTLNAIATNIHSGTSAETMVKLYCRS